ncbi:MAG: damage-inducible protein DinB [bacterium]|nr:damage-inducible protein DinB [bacterium]
MRLAETLLPEFDHETATARRCLDRAPQPKWDWKPHAKSLSLCNLVGHIANLPSWTLVALNNDTFDMAPPGEEPVKSPVPDSTEQALEFFDKNVAEARAAIESASNERLAGNWTLLSGGKTILTLPRIAVIRSFVMNHLIHHRGQLTVYLRLNDVPVPSIYGPSADESGMG